MIADAMMASRFCGPTTYHEIGVKPKTRRYLPTSNMDCGLANVCDLRLTLTPRQSLGGQFTRAEMDWWAVPAKPCPEATS